MLISFAVIFGWQMLIVRIYGPSKKPGAATTVPAIVTPAPAPTTTAYATTQAAPTTGSTSVTQPTSQQLSASPVHIVSPATQPYVATIGADAGYPMIVKINSAGAGLDSVTLKEFRAPGAAGRKRDKPDYVFQEPYTENNATIRALATQSVTINSTPVDLAGVNWTFEKQDAASATYVIDIGLAKIRKTFEVVGSAQKNGHRERYDLNVKYAIEN